MYIVHIRVSTLSSPAHDPQQVEAGAAEVQALQRGRLARRAHRHEQQQAVQQVVAPRSHLEHTHQISRYIEDQKYFIEIIAAGKSVAQNYCLFQCCLISLKRLYKPTGPDRHEK